MMQKRLNSLCYLILLLLCLRNNNNNNFRGTGPELIGLFDSRVKNDL